MVARKKTFPFSAFSLPSFLAFFFDFLVNPFFLAFLSSFFPSTRCFSFTLLFLPFFALLLFYSPHSLLLFPWGSFESWVQDSKEPSLVFRLFFSSFVLLNYFIFILSIQFYPIFSVKIS